MPSAVLLIDLQYDFIERPGLLPSLEDLSPPIERLLQHAREQGRPVIHIHTLVSPAGENRMPHWQAQDILQCVAGTRGAAPPPQFAPHPAETVITKQFFSGFSNPQLDTILREQGIEALWIAGLYTHSCIRATAMDAYERGYRITLAEDCLGSNDPLHARLSLDYMAGRVASVANSPELTQLTSSPLIHHSPVAPAEPVIRVQPDTAMQIAESAQQSAAASTAWQREDPGSRRQRLRDFRDRLAAASEELATLMVSDLGKPRRAAIEEMERAIGHVDVALALELEIVIAPGTRAIYEPHGAVAIVTPWNNPVAIAVGKLCAALLLGNCVVWKPAYQAHNISYRILELFRATGLPETVLQIVNGGALEVAALAADKSITAVSITGPEHAGSTIAPPCLIAGKPLQAELGGNNALLVMADADIATLAPLWARMAFGFAGQRCTAIRRFVVERSVIEEFEAHMCAALAELEPRSPDDENCEVGPLISARQLNRVRQAVRSAMARGARVVGSAPEASCGSGYYYSPTLLADLPADDVLVQEELFGPVAIILPADDFEQGLQLVNGVRQGLLACIATASEAHYEAFTAACDTGIVADGRGIPIHPAAPFGGRKASQLGPPEHGIWDRLFFGRVKACYRSDPT